MPFPPRFAVLVAVGPKPEEIARVADLVESISAYESGPCTFVMVDDGRQDRDLPRRIKFPLNISPAAVLHDRTNQKSGFSKSKGICSVMLTGMKWIGEHAPESRFVLKLDTDALVIAPFAAKLTQLLDSKPEVGMVGAYDQTPNGTPRDISRNREIVKLLHRPPIPWSHPRRAWRAIRERFKSGPQSVVRGHISAARRNGYVYGEHCLGGAYAVTGEFVRRMRDRAYLDAPQVWSNIDCPEDVMIGMYTKAVALNHLGFVGTNEVFGVRHEGLPFEVQELLWRGYSVIHSIKNDKRFTETDVRAFFAQRRKSPVARPA